MRKNRKKIATEFGSDFFRLLYLKSVATCAGFEKLTKRHLTAKLMTRDPGFDTNDRGPSAGQGESKSRLK
jgi:hypothetical protein